MVYEMAKQWHRGVGRTNINNMCVFCRNGYHSMCQGVWCRCPVIHDEPKVQIDELPEIKEELSLK